MNQFTRTQISSIAMQTASRASRDGNQDIGFLIQGLVNACGYEEAGVTSFCPMGMPTTWMFTSPWQAVKFFTLTYRSEISKFADYDKIVHLLT